MPVLFAMWLLLAGMKDVVWEGSLAEAKAESTGSGEVVQSEGPYNPPRP